MKKYLNNFEPSDKLVDFIIKGINEALALIKEESKNDKDMLKTIDRYQLKTRQEILSLLKEDIAQLIAMFSSRGRCKDYQELNISENGKFTPDFAHEVSINFLVVQDDLLNFIQTLHDELVEHIMNNGSFSSGWGEMDLNHLGLVLLLTEDMTPIYPPKVKATLVKTND